MIDVLTKRRKCHGEIHRGGGHRMIEPVTKVMQLQAKECRGLSAPPEAERRGLFLPQSLQRKPALPTPGLWTATLLNGERVKSCGVQLPRVCICYSSNRNLIQAPQTPKFSVPHSGDQLWPGGGLCLPCVGPAPSF